MKTDRSNIGRYFDKNDARDQHYFEANVGNSTLALFRSAPRDQVKSNGLDKVCAMVYGFDGVSGFLAKTVNTSFYLITLSKIKHVRWWQTPFKVGDGYFSKYTLTLADGTTLEALTQGNEQIVACGSGSDGKLAYSELKWSDFKSWSSSACVFDEKKAYASKGSLANLDLAFPFNNNMGRTSTTYLSAGLSMPERERVDTYYGHDQDAIKQKFAECTDGMAKLDELKRRVSADRAEQQAAELAAERAANVAALGSNQKSVESLQTSAKAGDAEARALLGHMYLTRKKQGTGDRDSSAISCLYLASKQGHAGARAELAKVSQEHPEFARAVITTMEMRVDNFMTQGEWASSKVAGCQ